MKTLHRHRSSRLVRRLLLGLMVSGAILIWFGCGLAVVPDGAEYRHSGIILESARFDSPWFALDAPGEYAWEISNLDFSGQTAYLSIRTTCSQTFDYWKLPLEVSVQFFEGDGRNVFDFTGNFTNVFWEQGYDGFLREGKHCRWVAHSEIGNYGIIEQGVDEQFTPVRSMAFLAGYGGDHHLVPISRFGNCRLRIEVRPLGPLPAGFKGRLRLERGWK